jgi:hypothetical protein
MHSGEVTHGTPGYEAQITVICGGEATVTSYDCSEMIPGSPAYEAFQDCIESTYHLVFNLA